MQKRAAKRKVKGEEQGFRFQPHAFWNRYALSARDPVVTVTVRPSLKEKAGSAWARAAGILVAGAGGLLIKRQLEFRDDFYDMTLYRDGHPIDAVRRYRTRTDEWFDGYYYRCKDSAYGGVYMYDPMAFEPGAEIVLKVRKSSDLTKWEAVKIDARTQKRIWDEFAPWRDAKSTGKANR